MQSEKVNKEMFTYFGLSDATVDLLFCLIRDIFEGGKTLCIGFVSMGDMGCTYPIHFEIGSRAHTVTSSSNMIKAKQGSGKYVCTVTAPI